MQMHGAERGRVRLVSEPLTIFRAKLDEQGEAADVEQLVGRFKWVPPRIESICGAAAEFYLTKLLQRKPTLAQVEEEQHLLMISWALRLDDGIYKTQIYPFPNGILEDTSFQRKDELLFSTLRDAAVHAQCTQADWLWQDYITFQQNEFPTIVSQEGWEALLADAKKKSLETMYSERGYWPLVRLLRGMDIAQQARSAPMSGGAGLR
jgi:hypothetical protein